MNSVGLVIASTGGNKLLRCVRSLRKMEPDIPIHVSIDRSAVTYQMLGTPIEAIYNIGGVYFDHSSDNKAFVNGGLNKAIAWMKSLGKNYACLLQDDLVFSHLPEHRHTISEWFDRDLLKESSGLSFAHFEALVDDPGMDLRRTPLRWDIEDLESDSLWRFLSTVPIAQNIDIRPPGASYFFRYEGPDKPRMWNRIGPTCSIIPIAVWEELGRFNEDQGIFYDDEYATECFLRGLPPIYAVTNFPYIHLHNQSVNPWADQARGVWGDCVGAFVRRYGATKAGIWKDDWEQVWTERQKVAK